MQQPGDGVNIDHQTMQEKKKKKMTDRRHNCMCSF